MSNYDIEYEYEDHSRVQNSTQSCYGGGYITFLIAMATYLTKATQGREGEGGGEGGSRGGKEEGREVVLVWFTAPEYSPL